jgi:hypothetical protein
MSELIRNQSIHSNQVQIILPIQLKAPKHQKITDFCCGENFMIVKTEHKKSINLETFYSCGLNSSG